MSDFYNKNMGVIEKLYPDFHKWILDQADMSWLHREGEQLYVTNGVTALPMYPPDNPTGDLDDLEKQGSWHKETCTAIIGLGLGHAVNRILSKMEKGHHIIVIEPIGQMYRLAFDQYDFSAHIKSGYLLFAPGKAEVEMVLSHLDSAKVVADWGILVDRTLSQRPEYWKLTEFSMNLLNGIQCNTGTVMSAGGKIADNDIATLPWVIRHRGVAELVDLFKDKPAVLVSTGPSLARNIHLLKDAQDKVVIIAVAQALRPLLAYDIRPDFICTVDFGEVNMTHLAGLCDETVPLVTINKAYAPMLKLYKGPKFISAGAVAAEDKTAHSILGKMGELPQGGSVAHMCLGLAVNLGCSPIMFVGQDLALSDVSHFNQADSMGKIEVVDGLIKWKVDDPRSQTLHGRDDIGMGPAQYVPGWWGTPVLTNTGLMSFITAFERMVEQYNGNVLNCTEGGCHLKGTRRMFLRDALDKYCYCKEVVDKTALAPLLTLSPDADKRVDEVMPLLREDLRLIDILIDHAEKGIETVSKIRKTGNQKKLKKLLIDNAKYSIVAHECAKKLPTVAVSIFWASRKIESREFNAESDMTKLMQAKNKKELVTRLDRNDVILKAALSAGKDLKKTYKDVELTLAAYVHNRPEGSILDPVGELKPADLTDARHYLDIGNFTNPLLEARRILNDDGASSREKEIAWDIQQAAYQIRFDKIKVAVDIQNADNEKKQNLVPQYMDLIDDSRKAGRDDDNMDKALEYLREAIALLPDREDARWGLASALLHLSRHDEAAKEYANLIERFPDNQRYRFEYGQVLVLSGEVGKGLEYISTAMKTSTEFDHFFGGIARLYAECGLDANARVACETHLAKYPHDRDVKILLEKLTMDHK